MGISALEWEEEVKKLPMNKRVKLANAIQRLKSWDTFNREYSGTGIFTIGQILKR